MRVNSGFGHFDSFRRRVGEAGDAVHSFPIPALHSTLGRLAIRKLFRSSLRFIPLLLMRLEENSRGLPELWLATELLEVIRLAESGRVAMGLMHAKLSDTQEHLLKTHVPAGTHLRLLRFLNDRATEHIAGRLAQVFSVTTI